MKESSGPLLLSQRCVGIGQDLFNSRAHDAERCFQVVRSIRRKTHRLFETSLKPGECFIQNRYQPGDFILRLGHRQSLVEMLRINTRCSLANGLNRSQCTASYPSTANCDNNEHGWDGAEHSKNDVTPDLVYFTEIGSDVGR